MAIPGQNPTTGIFPSPPVRATFHKTLDDDRSESSVVVNPTNSANLIGASKLFSDPQKYEFTVAAIYSTNGGASWIESEPLKLDDGWQGLSDPVLVFDRSGTAYLVTEAVTFIDNTGSSGTIDPLALAMVCYRSTDGGATWKKAIVIDRNQARSEAFDKPWAAASPKDGELFATWGYPGLQFARSTNGGQAWTGAGNHSINAHIGDGDGPEIDVDDDGHVHIFSHTQRTSYIYYLRSKNAGQSFEPQKQICKDLVDLDTGLPNTGFSQFPNATFRVVTLVTACCVPRKKSIAIAWADYRETVSRIYYNLSKDGGDGWTSQGVALLPAPPGPKIHDFHPQIAATGSGVVGCAFYRYYESSALIDVMFTASFDGGETFWPPVKLNDAPWNPAIDAPWSHHQKSVTFIGDYFGLDADADTFYALWTNTQDGVQELYFNSIATLANQSGDAFGAIYGQVFGGVAKDGGGFVIVNGHFVKVPPREPLIDVLRGIVALDAVEKMKAPAGMALRKALLESMATTLRAAADGVRRSDSRD